MAKEKFKYAGITWNSKRECCEFFGTTIDTINKYAAKFSITFSEALDRRRLELEEFDECPVHWDDDERRLKTKQIIKLAKYYNVNYSQVVNIMRETGMGVDGAVAEALKREEDKWFCISGKLYNSLSVACEDLHVSSRTIYNLAKDQDISTIEALELYVYLRNTRGGEKF